MTKKVDLVLPHMLNCSHRCLAMTSCSVNVRTDQVFLKFRFAMLSMTFKQQVSYMHSRIVFIIAEHKREVDPASRIFFDLSSRLVGKIEEDSARKQGRKLVRNDFI